MRIYLLPESGKFYKANLHSHTTVSDGKLTPEEAKDAYKSQGYSILAYTDHNVVLPCQNLTDDEFLALEGTEIDITDYSTVFERNKMLNIITLHINMIALRPSLPHPCWDDEQSPDYGTVPQYMDKMIIDRSIPGIKRVYGHEGVSAVVANAKRLGYFVTYNHPTWNGENYVRYMGYHGFDAVEVFNYGTIVSGRCDDDIHVYNDMINDGRRVYAVAGDDNHNGEPFDSLYSDSFGAWTMIKADKLDYESVGDALAKGNFYASQGPEIKALWLEGNTVHVECSDASSIYLTTGKRYSRRVYCPEGGTLTSADLRMHMAAPYFRITVVDKMGRKAFTNAYFLDDLGVRQL